MTQVSFCNTRAGTKASAPCEAAIRPGTWRQAVITDTAVLPISLVLNFVLVPLTDHWPRLAVVIFNAAAIVASLNWALLPALHQIPRGWATQRLQSSTTPTRHHHEEVATEE